MFASLMAAYWPWPRSRRVAVAVSGGADSLCLALLAKQWGDPVGLVVDHGLRPESAAEANETVDRLAGMGVPARILALCKLSPGPGIAARARRARYDALFEAAASLGLSDLLLGHHARDQAETVLMRRDGGSGPAGLAAMPALAHRAGIRLVRPLLGVAPGRLRATLRQAGLAWVEDPSNRNPASLRTRLRAVLDDEAGDGPDVAALTANARRAALRRAETEARVAATLAERATIFPEGYALLTPGPIDADSLAALIRMLGGQMHAPPAEACARLAAAMAGTLGGVRLMPAGRIGPGHLLVREGAGLEADIPALDRAIWDGRFQLHTAAAVPASTMLGAVGRHAASLRQHSRLPAAVMQTLPAIKRHGELLAVPHLQYFRGQYFTLWTNSEVRLTLTPLEPASCSAWVGDAQTARVHHLPC
jgi:tRNA(Ile)-lysidine synthase